MPARHPTAYSFLTLSTLPDRISFASVCVTDQVGSSHRSTPATFKVPVIARLGPHTTTLLERRSGGSMPLALIDYNCNIPEPVTPALACERLAMALPPRLLTPEQAALVHALGTIQGRAYAILAPSPH